MQITHLLTKYIVVLQKNSKWLNTVKDWVNKLGFGHLNFHTNNIAFYLSNIKQPIYDHAIQNLIAQLENVRNYIFFQNVFKINEGPAYTDICKFKEDRSTLCTFRISAHSLEIEKGMYYNIPHANRACLSCKAGKVEDELHLFLDCPSYAHLRQDFF